jgi:CubicO group peptidase (beta-lactamase class C family)
MNLKTMLWVILFLSAGLINTIRSQESPLREEVDKLIRFDTDIDYKKTPGFIVAVIDNDSTYYLSFGTRVKGRKEPFRHDDIFETGSLSKLLTASLVSLLEAEGKLSFDSKINNHLPTEYQNPRLDTLTVSHLLAHQSGFPKRPYYFGKKEKDIQNPYAHYKEEDLLKFYRDYIPRKGGFEYSHTNYGLLELVINKVTGESLQDNLEKYIFSPLGMESSFVDFPEQKTEVLVPGYNRAMKTVSPWSFSSFKASEGLKSTAADLVKYLRANMEMSGTPLDKLLDRNFTITSKPGFNSRLGVGLGWHEIDMHKFKIYMHTGRTSGYNAFAGMVRDTRTGVIILSNSSIGTEDLGMQILRMINYNWKRLNI